jgi:hypothetical protein
VHCLFLFVVLLLALGIYLAVGTGLGGSVEEVLLCSSCMNVMRPLKALALMGDAAFVGLFVGF